MTKEECEYCASEKDCVSTEHTIDCIFCGCQTQYPTNDTCPRCLHDRAWCSCSEAEQQAEINELLSNLNKAVLEFKTKWINRLK